MANSGNLKRRILCLQSMFERLTDERHALTMSEIIGRLAAAGYSAERKSVYGDIETLRAAGMDIIAQKGRTTVYFLASREFETPEIKLLADAVASSKFITEKKSRELIAKLGSLASDFEARGLTRQVYVQGRVKSAGEQIYYSVDSLHRAIAAGRQVEFAYFDYDLDKKKSYRHGGARYRVSPYALTWDDEKYYLICRYDKYDGMSHFRVDKIERLEVTDLPAEPLPDGFSVAEYSKKIFNMFSGESQRVTFRFDNSLIGAALDRFGFDAAIKKGDGFFEMSAEVIVSPLLFAWVFGFEGGVKIVAPAGVAGRFAELLRKQEELY